jgi:hypothetical protein
MEKYGFIYVWYDNKRRMYYIGSHWGTEDDGYICSSNRMRDAHRRRPQDFKRRIVAKGITRKALLEEEHKWLSLIPDDQLGKRYYNLRKHKWGHWSTDENSRMSVGQKIAASPNRKENISKAMKGRKPSAKTIEATIKSHQGKTYDEIHGTERSAEIRRKMSEKRFGRRHSEESKKKMGIRAREHMLGRKLSEETKNKMSESHKRRHLEKL